MCQVNPHVSASPLCAQDAPPGNDDVLCQPIKEGANQCGPCYYCQRGSFARVKMEELRNAMDSHQSVADKRLSRILVRNRRVPHAACHIREFCALSRLRFHQVRKEKLHEKVLQPSKKPRHVRLDLQELVRKAEEAYVDFQEVPLVQVGLHGQAQA